MTTMIDPLRRAVRTAPDAVAARCGDVEITYAQTWERARRLLGALRATGGARRRPRGRGGAQLPPLPRALSGGARRGHGAGPAQPAPYGGRAGLRSAGLRCAGAVCGRGHRLSIWRRGARHRPRRRIRGAARRRAAGRVPRRAARRDHGRPVLHRGDDRRRQGRDPHPPQPRRQRLSLPGPVRVPARHLLAGCRATVSRRGLDRRAGHGVARRLSGDAPGVRACGGARPHRSPRRHGDPAGADDARRPRR